MSELWTLEDLQAFTKIPMRTLKFYIATKEIPSIKIGRHRRFDPDEIKRWLKKKAT